MNKTTISSKDSVSKWVFIQCAFIMIAWLVLASLLACSPAQARSGGKMSQGRSADDFILRIRDRLNLNAEQEAKVRPIIEEEWEKRQEIVQSYRGQGRGS